MIHDPSPVPFACVTSAWRAHESELRGYLVHRLADTHLADDLLQDVFLKAMRQGNAFCRLDNPRAWLFQVARNALVDHARLAKATVPVPDSLTTDITEAAPVDSLAECLQRRLSGLTDDDRDVLRTCDLEGMTLQAFADARGLTLPAVKSRIQRARRRLREALMEKCQVQFDEAHRVCCHSPRVG